MSEGICKISDQDKETWSFSVVDVIGILTEQSDVNGARNCWKVLKNRLTKEGSQVVTSCARPRRQARTRPWEAMPMHAMQAERAQATKRQGQRAKKLVDSIQQNS